MSVEYQPRTKHEQMEAVDCQREECVDQTLIPVTVTAGDVEQQWCPGCVSDEFGLNYGDYKKRQQSIWRFVTPATVGAFLTGSLLMLLIASVTVV